MNQNYIFILLLYFINFKTVYSVHEQSENWIEKLNLPRTLRNYHISTNEELWKKCKADPNCPVKNGTKLWLGFEQESQQNNTIASSLHYPKCKKNLNPRVKNQFFEQADFGYLKPRKVESHICQSTDTDMSRLSCSDQLAHCFGNNLYIDFSNLKIRTSKRYREDVIQHGQIGGNCEHFDSQLLGENLEYKGYLTSWSDELQHFVSSSEFVMSSDFCDIVFEKPTILMKLDASVNMYHHFCDFLNLYASLHLNGSFNQDVDIIWWDTHPNGYIDKSYGIVWKAFSKNTPIELKSLDNKRVCFKNVLFPLLARQRDGLYYNTPLVQGCSSSSMFSTFSQFILHRLQIDPPEPLLEDVRVVILSRSTAFRKILNIRELLRAVGQLDNVTVKVVDYNEKIPFIHQLNTTSKADIFIGMHGAGLTHLLFLPDWAAVFEVYNCGDDGCYLDLARLRGIKYFTWPKEKLDLVETVETGTNPTSGEIHKKFANYNIDIPEFTRIVKKMVEYVRRNPIFVNARRRKRRKQQRLQRIEL